MAGQSLQSGGKQTGRKSRTSTFIYAVMNIYLWMRSTHWYKQFVCKWKWWELWMVRPYVNLLATHIDLCSIEYSLGDAPPRGVLTYLGMVERFRGYDPRFWDFRSDWVYILYLNTIRLTPFVCRKKSVCLYHI